MTTKTTQNPFALLEDNSTTKTTSRKLDYTPVLLDKSNIRSSEVISAVAKKPELFDLANKVLDEGNPQDLIDLIGKVIDAETIKTDAKILEGCDDDQADRLLKSRQSDRSKAKAKNPRSSMTVCKTYFSAMYAELLIREYIDKPYNGSSVFALDIDFDELANDQNALNRKIRSLQSKKSRLNKLAMYNDDARNELEKVKDDIERLQSLRPTTRTQVRSVVKDIKVDQLRDLLKNINIDDIPADQREQYQNLLSKLG